MVIFLETLVDILTIRKPKNPKIIPGTWHVNENFWIIVGCYISLETFWTKLINENIFGIVDWNFYHQKPETNLKYGKSMKKFE